MSGMQYKLVISLKKEDWSEFVSNNRYGNIYQTPEMMEVYMGTKRYEPVFLSSVDSSDNIIAVSLGVIIRQYEGIVGQFSSRAVLQGGPVFVGNEEGANAAKMIMQEHDKIAGGKAIFTEIRPIFEVNSLGLILGELGYNHEERINFLLDLDKSKEELWNNLSKKRRNGIRRAKKREVIIKEIEEKSEIQVFYDLLRETYENARWPPADIALFKSVFDVMVPNNMAKFFLAEHEKNYIGGILLLTYKGLVYDWYAGSSRDYANLCPNDLLVWYSIEWGLENGFHAFDFGGAGSPDQEYGVRDFKKQFGGRLVNPKRYTKVHSPMKMKIAKSGFEILRRVYPSRL